jgi:hypothetical protein
MTNLLGDTIAKVCKEKIFKSTFVCESLHEINNDNGIKLVNFASSKNVTDKSAMFRHCSCSIGGSPTSAELHYAR